MQSVGDNILVSMDKETEDEYNIKGTDITIKIATEYETNKNTRQFGIIYGTNPEMESIGLKRGRKVWFHHLVSAHQDVHKSYHSNRIEQIADEDVYIAPVGKNNNLDRQVYAYEDENGLQPILDFLFCKPLMKKSASSVIDVVEFEKEDDKFAEVAYLSDECKKAGLKVGDRVRFVRFADYKMDINGEELFRMKLPEIIYIERDGKPVLLPNPDKVYGKLIEEKKSSLYLLEEKFTKGMALSDSTCGEIKEGEHFVLQENHRSIPLGDGTFIFSTEDILFVENGK